MVRISSFINAYYINNNYSYLLTVSASQFYVPDTPMSSNIISKNMYKIDCDPANYSVPYLKMDIETPNVTHCSSPFSVVPS